MHESASLVMLVEWSVVVDDVEEVGVGETVVTVVKEGELQPLFAAETALDVKLLVDGQSNGEGEESECDLPRKKQGCGPRKPHVDQYSRQFSSLQRVGRRRNLAASGRIRCYIWDYIFQKLAYVNDHFNLVRVHGCNLANLAATPWHILQRIQNSTRSGLCWSCPSR